MRRRVDELTFQLADASQALRTTAPGPPDTTARPRLNPVMLLHAQDALQRSERLMRGIFDGALDAIVLIGQDGKLVDANPAACELFGRARDTLPGTPFASLSSAPASLSSAWQRLLEHGQERGSLEVKRPDGSLRQTEYSATSNVLPGVDIVLLRDVTERKNAESSLKRVNRLYSVLSKLNAAVLRIRDMDQLCDEACRILIEEGWLAMVWIGEATNDGIVRPIAFAGREEGYLSEIVISTEPGLYGNGPMGVAVREGRPDVCGDLDEPRMAPWRESALKRGYRSAAAVPLPIRGRRAVMAFYASESHFFGDQEVRLLERIAETLGIPSHAMHEERRRLEAETLLRESEERYRRIVETTSEGVITTDEQARVTFVNKHMADMLGYARAEMLGRVVFEFFPDDARPSGHERFDRRRLGTGDVYEQRYRHKDGREIWTLVSATPLTNAQGQFEGTIGMITDVTERRRERAESEALFGLSLDIMCVASFEGHFTRVNPAFERIIGYSMLQILARPYFDCVHPDDVAKTRREMERLGRGEASTRFENRFRCKDGSYRVLAWSAVAADGVVYAVARDVTDQRALEDQLRQAQKMEAIGNLAGGVAHDFNNLLSVMLGYTALALEDLPKGEPLRADLEQVEKAAHKAEALTRQLLAFSRRQILEPQVVDLNQRVRELDRMLSRLLGKHIELCLAVDTPVGRVYADPGQIEQVIMNLVVNARDAMPAGGQLTLATADVALDHTYAAQFHGVAPGRYVMLTVRDTGDGIGADTLAQIFEPFFTTKEKGKGTGLGLSTVYGIIKQSGGHIAVDTELGQGTTFKVYLPRSERLAPASIYPSPVVASLRGTETILLAEDDDAVRATMHTILQRLGYRVLEAAHGEDALMLCERYDGIIHMLLTDVVMPRMNGRQLAERVLLMRPEIKVLYVSGYTADGIVHQGELDAGIAYLPKPVAPDTLARKLRELFDMRLDA